MKLKDYEPRGQVQAVHEYDAWRRLREWKTRRSKWAICWRTKRPLRICKYVGFEPAEWVLPEPKQPPSRRPPGSRWAVRSLQCANPGWETIIDDFCVRCKRIMNHAIVSVMNGEPAKVRCRTCHNDHDYRHEQAPPSQGGSAQDKRCSMRR